MLGTKQLKLYQLGTLCGLCTMVHYAGFWKPNRTRLIAQLWDFIETSSFRDNIKGIKDIKDNDNDFKDIAV